MAAKPSTRLTTASVSVHLESTRCTIMTEPNRCHILLSIDPDLLSSGMVCYVCGIGISPAMHSKHNSWDTLLLHCLPQNFCFWHVQYFTQTSTATRLSFMQVLDRLTPVEQQLLSQRLTQLRHVLDPGFSPLNWNSLGIPDFVATCNKVSHLSPWQ